MINPESQPYQPPKIRSVYTGLEIVDVLEYDGPPNYYAVNPFVEVEYTNGGGEIHSIIDVEDQPRELGSDRHFLLADYNPEEVGRLEPLTANQRVKFDQFNHVSALVISNFDTDVLPHLGIFGVAILPDSQAVAANYIHAQEMNGGQRVPAQKRRQLLG